MLPSNVLLTSDVSPKALGSALVIGYRQDVTDSGDCCGGSSGRVLAKVMGSNPPGGCLFFPFFLRMLLC